MDDATRLISELEAKLSELDNKVAAYREDMAAEFRRFAQNLLQDVSVEVAERVKRRVIADGLCYPSLYPDSVRHESPDSPHEDASELERVEWLRGRRSPPPILHHTSGTPKEGPRSPHAREEEFLGFITPTYLPLLDGGSRTVHSPPVSPPPEPQSTGAKPDDRPTTPITEISQNVIRPGPPRRHHTDNTVSSTESAGSEIRSRRSALRRSSSSNKGSPRRVRFSVQGAEVLPTASPQGSQIVLSSLAKDASPVALDDSSLDASGTSLLDVDGEEDFLPIPKKVSSTEALRALSRNPLEGTVWTVVNPDSEAEDLPGANGYEESATVMAPTSSPSRISKSKRSTASPEPLRNTKPEIPQAEGTSPYDDSPLDQDEEEEDSEEEFLSMGSRAARKSPSPALPSPQPPPAEPVSVPGTVRERASSGSDSSKETVKQSSSGTENRGRRVDGADDEDDDELFTFDGTDLGLTSPRSPSGPKQPQQAEESSDEEDEDDEEEDKDQTTTNKASHSGPSPRAVTGVRVPSPQPSTPISKHLAETSIGSYKGTPLRMDPVVNTRLNDELAQRGTFASFVGSMDGRSGVDSSDLSSFRASITRGRPGNGAAAAAFSGTPGSLSERLMMEEYVEEMRAEQRRAGERSEG